VKCAPKLGAGGVITGGGNEVVTLKSFASDVQQVGVLGAEQLMLGCLFVCLLLAKFV
jgi:hypothetical protein